MFKAMERMHKRRILSLIAVVVIAVASFVILGKAGPPRPGSPNIILISLDTLRADRLGAYNYSRATSPFLDSWAAQSVIFDNAITVAPWTLPSHVSMFTGLYPSSHGVTRAKQGSIGPNVEMLSETLQKNGFQTYAVVGGGYVAKRYGFSRGFDNFVVNKGEDVSEAHGFPYSIKMAQEKIKTVDPTRPFFLFLHTYAVHCPYNPPAPYDSMFASPGAETIAVDTCERFKGLNSMTPAQARYLSDRYDGSVRYLDSILEKFFANLKEDGFLENTIIIITSDHGEEFLEHGGVGHRKSLHKELLMVPLIIGGPGLKPQRISDAVSLVDLFPTILESSGLPPSQQPEGHSLWALMQNRQEKFSRPPYQFSELDQGARLRSLLEPTNQHFILDLKDNSLELFDLLADPGAHRNIATFTPDRVAEWRSILDRMMKDFNARELGGLEPASKEQIEQLKTLGYL